MRGSRWTRKVLAAGFAAASASALAQSIPPPAPPPELEFTGPEAGWPPQVKGATDMRVLPVEPTPTALTPAFAARMGEVAAASPVVRRNLGDRFALINAVLVDGDKERGGELLPAEQQLGRVTFYSYSRNVAVRALVRAGEVLEVRDVEGFQPPESPEEIDRAVRLAREDPRISGLVRNLEGTAMVTEPGEGRPGSGHRVLYASFAPAGMRTAEVMALVDLTDNRVIEAGPTPGVR